MERASRRPSRAALLLSTITILVIVQLPIPGWLAPGDSLAALLQGEGIFWALTLLIVLYVLFVEKRPLTSIGLVRPTWKTFAFGLLGAVVMVVGAFLIYEYLFPALGLQPNQGQMTHVQRLPLWFQCMVLVRAPVFEEIFYRGFAVERLSEILRLRWLAALTSLIGFTFAHLSYWGWSTLIVVAFQGGVLTALYLWRRDLGANMVAHFTSDLVGFLAF